MKEIETTITDKLIDNRWFIAKEWDLPDLHFREYAWDPEIDHDWHEFDGIEETSHNATEKNTIGDFLFVVQRKSEP